jgi:hypothetical protein
LHPAPSFSAEDTEILFGFDGIEGVDNALLLLRSVGRLSDRLELARVSQIQWRLRRLDNVGFCVFGAGVFDNLASRAFFFSVPAASRRSGNPPNQQCAPATK